MIVRLLFVLGVLCLMMNFVGAVGSYYATMRSLSADPDAAVDALADSAYQLQSNPWPTFGWTVLGVTLIAIAAALFVARRKRRRVR